MGLCISARDSITSNLCVVCNLQPKRPGFQYCGKACGRKAMDNLCSLCRRKPRYAGYLFCGKACGKKACKGCHVKERYYDRDQGRQLDYCGKTCANKFNQGNGPGIKEVAYGDPKFNDVVKQFDDSWRHTNIQKPSVVKIYRIKAPSDVVKAYERYRSQVEAKRGLSNGNERRRWHGTKRSCLLGDPGHTQLCNNTDCSLCSIIRTSFDLNHSGSAHGYGRFGRGIYTSSTSSKSAAQAYTKNVGTASGSQYKAMLLTKVVVGKGYRTLVDEPGRTEPPQHYDSVLGEKGSSLMHDELVVYCSQAIIPAYLVLFNV